MRLWNDNPRWMIRDAESNPTHDPPMTGCESCGWLDRGEDVRTSDLIWVTDSAYSPDGLWLCMECD